jgi:hypothetical protein
LKIHKRIAFILLYLKCGLVFTYFYFLYTHDYSPGSYERIANFEADKVFQTRLLITSIANFIEPAIPLLKAIFQWAVPYPISYEVILQLINALFLTALILLIRPLAEVLGYTITPAASLFILVPVSWNFIFINGLIDGAGLYYPYDIPSLTFFAAGIILFMQKKWSWFYPIFILACLNRESACFITLGGFLLTFQTGKSKFVDILKSNRQMFSQVIAQAGIWLGLRLILSYAFRNNPGEFFEQPHSMFDFMVKVGSGEAHWAMNNPRWFLTLFAGVWIVPLLLWENLNGSLKRFLLLGLVYLLVLFFRSNMMETRVYNELNVILSMSAICTLFGPSMNRWMIVQRDYGQLGNRLHTHANATAWCLENKLNLLNLSFVEYAESFSRRHGKPIHSLSPDKTFFSFFLGISNRSNLLDRFCRSDKWLNHSSKFFRVYQKDDDQKIGGKELHELFEDEPKKKFTLMRAWDLRCPDLVTKHQKEIREIFTPKLEFTENAQLEIAKIRKKHDCVVGVHARRGDYKEYLGGTHFHSWDSYRNWIIQTKNLMEENGRKNIGFLLCSDENVTSSLYADLPVHFMREKSVMTDLHALSLCDFNIGPPSSFGTWLSWYGKAPRLHLEKDLNIRSLDQFSVCLDC